MTDDYTYPDPDAIRHLLLVYLLHADGPPLLTTLVDLAHLAGVSELDVQRTFSEYEPKGSSDQGVWKAMVAARIADLRKEGLMTRSGSEGYKFNRQELTEAGIKVAEALATADDAAALDRLRGGVTDEAALPDDALEPALRQQVTTYRFIRDTATAREAKRLAGYTCQVCGHPGISLPGGSYYAEAHHVIPLHRGGPDVLTNLLCVCPSCHVALDYLAREISPDVVARSAHLKQDHVDDHNRRVHDAS